MKNLSVLIKPASALCNLRCKYCFYANVSSLREVRCHGIMQDEVTEKMIDNIFLELEENDHINFGFQGGEPTIAGLSYFENFVDLVHKKNSKVNITYSIQTNGTFIDEKWCEFLKKNNFLVGLSLDGFKDNHNINRLDGKRQPTYDRVKHAKDLFDKYEIEYNILTVLTEQLSYHAKEVFEYMKDENIKYLQLIPCLDELDAKEKNEYALTPQGFYRFYRELIPLWKEEFEKGNYISIKLFDDIFNLIVNRQVNACGLNGSCGVQYIIESNGDVYPCDFYALDKYKLGNITQNKLSEMYYNDVARDFLYSRPQNALPSKCFSCKYRNICRGGCKRMKDAMYVDEKKDFCGYQSILDLFIPEVNWIINQMENIYAH